MTTRDALWQRLKERALVEGELPTRSESSPWFVRVMLGFAGWIGAVFLLLFVGIGLSFIIKSATASLVVGALACAAAALLYRLPSGGDFIAQFALAVSLAGQGLLVLGWSDSFRNTNELTGVATAVAVQQALLFFIVPNFVHRVWTAWSGACAAVIALDNAGVRSFAPAVVTAGFIALWLREFDHPRRGELIRAAGYGLALAAVQTAVMQGDLILSLLHALHREFPFAWAGAAASGAVLLWAVVALLQREGVALSSGSARFAVAGAAIIALASLKAPGLGAATAILVIGYANGNRLLAGLGIFALIGYLSVYYYWLQGTLLEKSALLAAAGIALLLARLVLKRWWPPCGAEVGHA